MKHLTLAAAFFLVGSSLTSAALQEPVQLDSGLVAGVAGAHAEVRVFKGIPYAAAPVGDLRWREPVDCAHWEGVLAADHFRMIPEQYLPPAGSFYNLEYFRRKQPPMSEDCLYLNIWTAAASNSERRPVMLWIHGGGNVQGYGSEPCFDGEALARHGVVLVTFNYRLNIFGLFAYPDLSAESEHHVSGNYEELDQIAALRWIHRNIAGFGGDPNNVTIFGQSSGGASVSRLLVAPQAKGLFERAILESASVLNSRDSKVKLADMEKRGVELAESLGVNSLKELRALPAEKILAAGAKIKFDPNVDGWVMPDLPADIFARGGEDAVPMLIGSTSDEGSYAKITAEQYLKDATTRYGVDAEEFFKLYPVKTDSDAFAVRHDARRDESLAGARSEARRQAALGVPVYLYEFDRKPPGRDRAKYGAFHSAEVEYVFNTLDVTDRPWEAVDQRLADDLTVYWANFAATGNPNGAGLPEWPAFDPATNLRMELGERVVPEEIVDGGRLDLLERVLMRLSHLPSN
jgi:para-nitrobenzyl esterase